jgi:hypothetical protein
VSAKALHGSRLREREITRLSKTGGLIVNDPQSNARILSRGDLVALKWSRRCFFARYVLRRIQAISVTPSE